MAARAVTICLKMDSKRTNPLWLRIRCLDPSYWRLQLALIYHSNGTFSIHWQFQPTTGSQPPSSGHVAVVTNMAFHLEAKVTLVWFGRVVNEYPELTVARSRKREHKSKHYRRIHLQ